MTVSKSWIVDTVYVTCFDGGLCRMYCSRRLQRIRKALHFTQGHRNRYQKKAITVDKITDARYVSLSVFWSYNRNL